VWTKCFSQRTSAQANSLIGDTLRRGAFLDFCTVAASANHAVRAAHRLGAVDQKFVGLDNVSANARTYVSLSQNGASVCAMTSALIDARVTLRRTTVRGCEFQSFGNRADRAVGFARTGQPLRLSGHVIAEVKMARSVTG